jgi:hypothetical protein
MANLLLSVMGAIAEFERELIKERQREGIAIAKKRGAKANPDSGSSCRPIGTHRSRGIEDEACKRAGRVQKYSLYVCKPGTEVMRVLVDGLDTMIEGEVIGGELLDGQSRRFDLEAEFTVRCDDGACFTVHGWLVAVEILNEPPEWVM